MNKTLFALMCIFFNQCGVPEFMEGKESEGVKKIVTLAIMYGLTVVTCGLFSLVCCIYMMVVSIKGIIRGVKVFKMSDEEFAKSQNPSNEDTPVWAASDSDSEVTKTIKAELDEKAKESARVFFDERKKKIGKKRTKIDEGKVFFIVSLLIIPIISFFIFYVVINFNSWLLAFKRPLYDGTNAVEWGFYNFKTFFEKFKSNSASENMFRLLINTFIFFFMDMFVSMPLSLIICYFIYKKIAGYKTFRTIIYLPVIMTAPIMVALYKSIIEPGGPIFLIGELLGMPGSTDGYREASALIPLTGLFNKLGIELPGSFYNEQKTALPTMLFYMLFTGLGGRFVLFGGAMNTIDPSVVDAGKIDGAGPVRELVSIIIPCIWPTLATLILMGATGIFTASGPSLLFDQGRQGTSSISYFIYDLTTSPNANSDELAAAVGIIFTLLAFPIVMIVKKVTRVTEE